MSKNLQNLLNELCILVTEIIKDEDKNINELKEDLYLLSKDIIKEYVTMGE